ncbi:N4-gp56 family major capsid protein [Kurthia populi]|uniref:N4-gp56 family major capsid protein n=1 Tax=Kurthia populi TaxID=1562132 RepID=A0ABW5XXY1_9BACL|nr:N4-gp56 family major capsid protein [Candidatus Kurthia intestinigallinarum]
MNTSQLLAKLNLQFFAQTQASDLVDPEVMAPAIAGKMENAIKFTKYADLDTTLVGQPGSTITRPKYGYIGAAEDLTEGVPMDTSKMSMTTTEVAVKETGKAVEITEKAIITNVGGTVGEAERQLAIAMADKVEIDYIAALDTALQTVGGSPTTPAKILEAVTVFDSEGDLDLVLFMNPADYTTLVQNLLTVGGTVQERALTSGQVSELLGLKAIERSRRVAAGKGYLQIYSTTAPEESEDPTSAVEIVLKQDVGVNKDADILKRTVVIAANRHYVVNLKDDKGVVKFTGA